MDWEPVVNAAFDFLDKNPGYRKLERKLILYLLNSLGPQSRAHYRTMAGSVGEFINTFAQIYETHAKGEGAA